MGRFAKDKAYFFVDYQGTQMTQGQETGVHCRAEPRRSQRESFRSCQPIDRQGQQQLLGQSVVAEAWLPGVGGRTVLHCGLRPMLAQCVFPNAKIPASMWSAPAKSLMQYIPQPNVGQNLFSDSAENETLGDNKGCGALRCQHAPLRKRLRLLSGRPVHHEQSLSDAARRSECAGLQRAL